MLGNSPTRKVMTSGTLLICKNQCSSKYPDTLVNLRGIMYLVVYQFCKILIEFYFIYLQHSIFCDAGIGKGVGLLVQNFLNELTAFAPVTA